MQVSFEFATGDRAAIDAVLHRIRATGGPGCWTTQPDEIRVVQRLTDGRSASDVYEIVVRTGPQESPMVLKVGPSHELDGEWQAFDTHLRGAAALFAPIRVVAVDQYDATSRTFTTDDDGKPRRLQPLELAEAAARHDGDVEPGLVVEVRDLTTAWWGERLMGERDSHAVRIEVIDDSGRSMRRLARDLDDGTSFHVRGVVREVRARTHRERLLADLGELTAKDGELHGDDAHTPDPFVDLPRILEARRRDRIRALVHGDMNPRNVLLVDHKPVLIDYAFTRPDEPFFLDFTRLEGSAS